MEASKEAELIKKHFICNLNREKEEEEGDVGGESPSRRIEGI